jgi:hypothetical protein
MQGADLFAYEGWNFNSGNYLFTTDNKIDTCFEVLLSFSVVTSVVYNRCQMKSSNTFSSSCCVDSSNGADYCLKNLGTVRFQAGHAEFVVNRLVLG